MAGFPAGRVDQGPARQGSRWTTDANRAQSVRGNIEHTRDGLGEAVQ